MGSETQVKICPHGIRDGVNCMVCDTDGAVESSGWGDVSQKLRIAELEAENARLKVERDEARREAMQTAAALESARLLLNRALFMYRLNNVYAWLSDPATIKRIETLVYPAAILAARDERMKKLGAAEELEKWASAIAKFMRSADVIEFGKSLASSAAQLRKEAGE